MGAAAGLRVELDGKGGDIGVPDPFAGAVVGIDIAHLAALGEVFGVDRVAVVLAGDEDPVGTEVFDRLVGASMAVFELDRLAAAGEG